MVLRRGLPLFLRQLHFATLDLEYERMWSRAWQVACEVSNMEPVRATLEADLAIAPLLSHSVPDSLEILGSKRRLWSE